MSMNVRDRQTSKKKRLTSREQPVKDCMAGYTKLFCEIIHSSIWQEPNDAKVVWISILALKGRDQICRATIPALAKYAECTLERCEEILQKFQDPDKYSNSQEHDGRRIQRVDGGWLVLNGAKYRDKMNAEEVREYNRVKKQEQRVRDAKLHNVPDRSVRFGRGGRKPLE